MSLTAPTRVFKDARDFQILYLSMFLLYGIWFLSWDANIVNYFTVFASCFLAQCIGIAFYNAPLNSLKSAAITALGLCILFKANILATFALVGFISIIGKFLIQYKGKHVFNPSLFGIVVCLLITNDAWVSPGQWGNNFVVVSFLSAAALLVLLKVGRIDTSLSFLVSLMLLEFARTVIYLGWEPEVFWYKFTSGTILLFAFFMVTDPVTTPKSAKGRIIWGCIIGVLTFVLSNWFQNYTAPIWALLIATPITIFLNKLFKGNDFYWLPFSHTSFTKKPIQQ
jgi:Na+-transporting NADH:ubiquinone oxidoreductase subunit NqrB